MARAHASSVETVPGSSRSMRHNIFPPFIRAAAVAAAVAAVIRSSSSNCAPARPPRFIEENTTLSSSAPSSSRSSRMSEVASTPSTPGSASAARSRSSRSVRLFIAVGRDPTPRAPRAGWSAATIISLPLPRTAGRMVRVCQARSTACGSDARTSVISA